jgi:hypothetical protein
MLDLLFWLSLLYWSLMPTLKTPWIEVAEVPVNSKDIVLFALCCICLLSKAIKKPAEPQNKLKNWHCYLPITTIFILLYAGFTMVFYSYIIPPQGSGDIKPMGDLETISMRITLVLAAAAFLIAYIQISLKSREAVHSFLWQLTIALAGLGMLYSFATIAGTTLPGVRSEFNATQSDYGVLRVVGPLFGASTGHFILVPALAFAVQEFYRSRTKRMLKLCIMFALMLTIIGLASRAALLILAIFFIFMGFSMKNKKQAIASIAILVIIISAAAGIFFSKASSERLTSLEDSARSETYIISSKIIHHRDLEYNIVGSGYGSYWPWYMSDLENSINTYIPMFQTRFGYVLYHPHSVAIIMIVELGLFGTLYFAYLWIILGRLLIDNFKNAPLPIFNSGVVASAFSMFVDLFIFKGPQINVVWWLYFIGALHLNSNSNSFKL